MTLDSYCSCLFILKYKIKKKLQRTRVSVVKMSQGSIQRRKAPFLRTTPLDPNSFRRGNTQKSWEKLAPFQACRFKTQVVLEHAALLTLCSSINMSRTPLLFTNCLMLCSVLCWH